MFFSNAEQMLPLHPAVSFLCGQADCRQRARGFAKAKLADLFNADNQAERYQRNQQHTPFTNNLYGSS